MFKILGIHLNKVHFPLLPLPVIESILVLVSCDIKSLNINN